MNDNLIKIISFDVLELSSLQLSSLYRNHRLHSANIKLGKTGIDDTMTLNWCHVIHFEGMIVGTISDGYLLVSRVIFSGRRGLNDNKICEWETFKNSFKGSKGILIASQLWEDGNTTILTVKDGIVTEELKENVNV